MKAWHIWSSVLKMTTQLKNLTEQMFVDPLPSLEPNLSRQRFRVLLLTKSHPLIHSCLGLVEAFPSSVPNEKDCPPDVCWLCQSFLVFLPVYQTHMPFTDYQSFVWNPFFTRHIFPTTRHIFPSTLLFLSSSLQSVFGMSLLDFQFAYLFCHAWSSNRVPHFMRSLSFAHSGNDQMEVSQSYLFCS